MKTKTEIRDAERKFSEEQSDDAAAELQRKLDEKAEREWLRFIKPGVNLRREKSVKCGPFSI